MRSQFGAFRQNAKIIGVPFGNSYKMHVLALVPGGIGDQILFFPTLDGIKRAYPEARIGVVVEPRAKAAYRVCKHFHDRSLEVLVFNFKDRNAAADWSNLLGNMRDRQYDAVLSLGKRWLVGFLLWLSGIRKRVGYGNPGSLFLTDPVLLKTEQYAAHMYYDLLQGLQISAPCPDLSIALLKEDIAWAEAAQEKLGVKESGYLLLHGGSSQLARSKGIDKIYPPDRWQQVLQGIRQKQPDLPVLVVEGPEDAEFVAGLAGQIPDLKRISPPDIGKLAATIAGANLMLCTDSAPMHLAVAVQTYTVALFGPTDPAKLLPKNDKFVGIQSPTGKMGDIEPQAILQKMFG